MELVGAGGAACAPRWRWPSRSAPSRVLRADRPGPVSRTLAVCRVAGQDLGEWMVRNGWALAYRRYSTAYVPAEEAARARRLHLWAGAFEPPWEWRRQRRRAATVVSAAEAQPAPERP
jgi:endonuclease YncB( thermonuclease family)